MLRSHEVTHSAEKRRVNGGTWDKYLPGKREDVSSHSENDTGVALYSGAASCDVEVCVCVVS